MCDQSLIHYDTNSYGSRQCCSTHSYSQLMFAHCNDMHILEIDLTGSITGRRNNRHAEKLAWGWSCTLMKIHQQQEPGSLVGLYRAEQGIRFILFC